MVEFDFDNKTYIRFSAGNDPISWLIQARTGCKWSHADLLLPSGQLLGSLPGGGVQLRQAIRGETRFAICEVFIARGYEYALSQINSPYDWLAVCQVGLPFYRDWKNDESKWYCTELISASLLEAGCPIVNPHARGIYPRDLWYSRLVKAIE